MSSSFHVAMPRPAAPPTPQPSTEIASKSDGHATHVDSSFALPPAALGSTSARGSTTSSTSSNASDSSYNPHSPHLSKPSPPNARKRPSTLLEPAAVQDGYTLPPPPTRSRKIIQMKPKNQHSPPAAPDAKPAAPATPAAGTTAKAGGGKKKQANGTTAAGRKIARKTAHSLIERRRRSKMNEEFGVLKDMIPACAGQEMHKLAILQASIDYMRYLEQCVTDLKASSNARSPTRPTPLNSTTTTPQLPPAPLTDSSSSSEDEQMEDAVSPTTIHPPPTHLSTHHQQQPQFLPSLPPSTTTSPILYAHDRSHSSTTSPAIAPTTDPRHYSITSSIRSTAGSPQILPSPAFSAMGTHIPPFPASLVPLTSPALRPQMETSSRSGGKASNAGIEEDEATAALLMLNSDRRNWDRARGMSVRDLLSG